MAGKKPDKHKPNEHVDEDDAFISETCFGYQGGPNNKCFGVHVAFANRVDDNRKIAPAWFSLLVVHAGYKCVKNDKGEVISVYHAEDTTTKNSTSIPTSTPSNNTVNINNTTTNDNTNNNNNNNNNNNPQPDNTLMPSPKSDWPTVNDVLLNKFRTVTESAKETATEVKTTINDPHFKQEVIDSTREIMQRHHTFINGTVATFLSGVHIVQAIDFTKRTAKSVGGRFKAFLNNEDIDKP